ncbi:ATP-grasp domain-containing protein [Streptomyces sp. SCA3-4]|uniref:acetyl/propionyl/methylcrotonyl-CoA carboxylase subunit alpha n=1 Tax=Streptomyces sichuanensis TaxID=2871810 RepID=UPI001CE32142|nr:biotin carboxylase N-terminal domain-containing protein [Streptomyces sichuanensis]MCA6092416.1 ATP-grasp domain-containing protein [Streptomyces sichuanensis]
MISSVLVANRGEIACRIFRTCRELGLATVAVHSDADADARHVREADAAVRLPGSAPADTYLRGDLLIAAARAAGADAVHPGYGFLSENAAFARSVRDAGLVWIGPPPEAVEAMASKTRAKQIMADAGVPLLAPLAPEAVTGAGLPVLIKAAAGGGGRGMRVVRDLSALPGELASARAEAAAAFGDGEVFVEPYVVGGRHVEVQVLADEHGTVWTLGTRDCSLQRRHQKVVEEAPAPGLPDALVRTLCEAAEAAVRAIGYVSAGTVEFLVAADGRPYFLEMNTRLQVEHPVTEAVYGVDLVALQLRIAEGVALGSPPEAVGHAVEARLYAEDPGRGWAPQAGVVHRLAVGDEASGVAGASGGRRRGLRGGGPGPYIYGPGTPHPLSGVPSGPQIHGSVPDPRPSGPVASRPFPPADRPVLRVDSGYEDGDRVGVHYDPLLAKVVVWAGSRAEAVRLLARVLELGRLHGPSTNRDVLVRSLRHPTFVGGRMDTGFFDAHLAEVAGSPGDARLAALAAAVADAQGRHRFGGWRNVPSQPQIKTYRCGDSEYEIRYRLTRDGLDVEGFPGLQVLHADRERVVLEAGGVRRVLDVASYGPSGPVYVDTFHAGSYVLTPLSRFPDPTVRSEPGSLLAPMPGTVVRLADGVAAGRVVRAGQPLLWLEAMKMEHRVVAPASGTLTALHAAPGRQVEVGELLAVVTETEEKTS